MGIGSISQRPFVQSHTLLRSSLGFTSPFLGLRLGAGFLLADRPDPHHFWLEKALGLVFFQFSEARLFGAETSLARLFLFGDTLLLHLEGEEGRNNHFSLSAAGRRITPETHQAPFACFWLATQGTGVVIRRSRVAHHFSAGEPGNSGSEKVVFSLVKTSLQQSRLIFPCGTVMERCACPKLTVLPDCFDPPLLLDWHFLELDNRLAQFSGRLLLTYLKLLTDQVITAWTDRCLGSLLEFPGNCAPEGDILFSFFLPSFIPHLSLRRIMLEP